MVKFRHSQQLVKVKERMWSLFDAEKVHSDLKHETQRSN